MIKVTTVLQLDSSEVSIMIDTTAEKAQKALLNAGYEFNENTEYWEKENEMVLIEEVEE
ncbi:hypothetical protein ACKA04_04565 [Helcococcus kunzii]|uniref:hypothetical protein n=1 Tax=Helcococcus kunzii TaxID=40091 RepID=UPI0038A23387